MPTVAKQFAHTLREIGVRSVFGVPSGNMIDYIEALRQEDGIDFITTGHESTAAFMAGVCGRLTGVPGACFGTFGPGATNLSTGVGSAFLDRFPMIAFTDEMPERMQGRKVQMNIDHQALFQPITKCTTRFGSDDVSEIILKAAGIAVDEVPGPVHIGVPSGIGLFRADESAKQVNYLRVEKKLVRNNFEESIEEARKLLQKSVNPVLAVGLGAVRAGTKDLLNKFIEKIQVPVVLTPMAKGMVNEENPWYAGVLFHALSNRVAEIYKEADLIIGIGYDPVEFNYEQWMPLVPLIHIDTTLADVDEDMIENVVNLTGKIKYSLNRLMQVDTPFYHWSREHIVLHKSLLFDTLIPQNDILTPSTVITELREFLPEDGILTVDVGAHLHLVGQLWKTPSPEKLLMTNGWSSMGFAVPAALAAKLCYPELSVACLVGDGGFRMSVGELATAKQLSLPIVFVVVVDESLSLIRIKQEKKNYNNHYGTDLNLQTGEPTNHYFGVPVKRVEYLTDYKNALKEAFTLNHPVVIEVVVDGKAYDDLVLKPNK